MFQILIRIVDILIHINMLLIELLLIFVLLFHLYLFAWIW